MSYVIPVGWIARLGFGLFRAEKRRLDQQGAAIDQTAKSIVGAYLTPPPGAAATELPLCRDCGTELQFPMWLLVPSMLKGCPVDDYHFPVPPAMAPGRPDEPPLKQFFPQLKALPPVCQAHVLKAPCTDCAHLQRPMQRVRVAQADLELRKLMGAMPR